MALTGVYHLICDVRTSREHTAEQLKHTCDRLQEQLAAVDACNRPGRTRGDEVHVTDADALEAAVLAAARDGRVYVGVGIGELQLVGGDGRPVHDVTSAWNIR